MENAFCIRTTSSFHFGKRMLYVQKYYFGNRKTVSVSERRPLSEMGNAFSYKKTGV